MGKLVFSVLWTGFALLIALTPAGDLQDWERALVFLFPCVGAVFTWHSWRMLRRRRSLRTDYDNGVAVYVWIELDGRERRSTEDPRPDWDSGDGDDGGDGGGD